MLFRSQSGTPDRPIVIKAAGDGEAIFDGDGNFNLFNVMAANYNYFEGLTIRNTDLAFLAERYGRAQQSVETNSGATTKNSAKNVIFILLAGAPSHTDLFDLKVVPNVTPASFNPETINGALFPTGLLPNLANNWQNNDFAIVRSMQSHALVHSLEIGRAHV